MGAEAAGPAIRAVAASGERPDRQKQDEQGCYDEENSHFRHLRESALNNALVRDPSTSLRMTINPQSAVGYQPLFVPTAYRLILYQLEIYMQDGRKILTPEIRSDLDKGLGGVGGEELMGRFPVGPQEIFFTQFVE